MRLPHIPVFLIFYSTTYTILTLVLVFLLLITPGEAVRQALKNKQLYNVFVIPSVYLLTLIVTVSIFGSRLFTTRSVLAGIPKTYIPIEKGDVGKRVRRMIEEGLARSRRIAWQARPRDLKGRTHASKPAVAESTRPPTRSSIIKTKTRSTPNKKATTSPLSQSCPGWGIIAHRGWSSPTSPDLPNLQYSTVISELPHLIEAKAVSLAPPDPLFVNDTSSNEPGTTHPPNVRAVALLQRSTTMNLRDYLSYLTTLGLITPPTLGAIFLSQYESARFSTVPLSEPDFRALMRSFADILRGMSHLDPSILATLLAELDASDTDSLLYRSSSDNNTEDSQSTQDDKEDTHHLRRDSSTNTIRTPSSRLPSPPSQQQQPGRSKTSRLGLHIPSSKASRPSFARATPSSSSSNASLGSVIRLTDEGGELPYTINSAPV